MLNRRQLFQFAGTAALAGAGGAAWMYYRSRYSEASGGGPFRHYPSDPVAAENFQQKLFIPVASGPFGVLDVAGPLKIRATAASFPLLPAIAACNDCAIECGNCFAHMVGKESMNECPACCIECAAICRLCADAMARNSSFAKQTCKLCADICDWCAKQCGAHDMDHCKRCAEACRCCADACRKMAG